MRLAPKSVVLCALFLVGCSSGVTIDDLRIMPEDDVEQFLDDLAEEQKDDLIEEAASTGRCEETELDGNIDWQQYKDRFVDVASSLGDDPSPQELEMADQMLEGNLASIYSQTPAGGQGEFARSACEHMLQFFYAGQADVVVKSPILLMSGYASCQMGPLATAPVESVLSSDSVWSFDEQTQAELDVVAVDLLEWGADLAPVTDSAFVHLCPQIEHNPPDPDRNQKIAALREQVDARAERFGICRRVDAGAAQPQRVYVHEGNMACSEAEELILTGLERTRTNGTTSATLDNATCNVASFGDYDSTDFDVDFSFTCYGDDGAVIGLQAPPTE